MVNLEQDPRGVILPVRAHAGARRNAIVGERGGALRVVVTAVPEKGKANRDICALLAKEFGVPKSSIELLSGATSQQKRFLIVGAGVNRLHNILTHIIE